MPAHPLIGKPSIPLPTSPYRIYFRIILEASIDRPGHRRTFMHLREPSYPGLLPFSVIAPTLFDAHRPHHGLPHRCLRLIRPRRHSCRPLPYHQVPWRPDCCRYGATDDFLLLAFSACVLTSSPTRRTRPRVSEGTERAYPRRRHQRPRCEGQPSRARDA